MALGRTPGNAGVVKEKVSAEAVATEVNRGEALYEKLLAQGKSWLKNFDFLSASVAVENLKAIIKFCEKNGDLETRSKMADWDMKLSNYENELRVAITDAKELNPYNYVSNAAMAIFGSPINNYLDGGMAVDILKSDRQKIWKRVDALTTNNFATIDQINALCRKYEELTGLSLRDGGPAEI